MPTSVIASPPTGGRSNLITIDMKNYYIYIITNYNNTVLYTGVTNNLERRIQEHKSKTISSFSNKYNLNKIVYYEQFSNINDAISREKQIKGGSRKKKVSLVNNLNPEWRDLSMDE
ncbi:MAG: GIY-YIG nuclease family protein [Candidatus Paceibacterota bacterium]